MGSGCVVVLDRNCHEVILADRAGVSMIRIIDTTQSNSSNYRTIFVVSGYTYDNLDRHYLGQNIQIRCPLERELSLNW